MSLREWNDRQSEERGWLIRLEFGLVATLVLGSLVIAVVSLIWAASASAHPGGLAADGCHNDRKNGGRHCHRAAATRTEPRQATRGEVYYANCTAARAAGAAPVRRGDPGYARHLDRDGDGIGCE
ncbi:excalibur calcium-binding domain-containing protein [Tsuneonella flava]|nr:excalibur calcium-binding domain-containing protein [Tsuneonella flava]